MDGNTNRNSVCEGMDRPGVHIQNIRFGTCGRCVPWSARTAHNGGSGRGYPVGLASLTARSYPTHDQAGCMSMQRRPRDERPVMPHLAWSAERVGESLRQDVGQAHQVLRRPWPWKLIIRAWPPGNLVVMEALEGRLVHDDTREWCSACAAGPWPGRQADSLTPQGACANVGCVIGRCRCDRAFWAAN
jgi:hypothetical protein